MCSTELALQGLQYSYPGMSSAFALQVPAFSLRRGEAAVLYGPSGCGKTTFLNLLAGVIPGGIGERARAVFPQVSYVMHESTLLPWLSIEQHPKIEARLRRRSFSKASLEEALRRFELDPSVLRKRPVQLSLGMRQRVEIAMALGFDVDLLLLDEGLAGIDAAVRREVIATLRLGVEDGRFAVLATSHNVVDILRLANRFWTFEGGRLLGPTELRMDTRYRLDMSVTDLIRMAAEYNLA